MSAPSTWILGLWLIAGAPEAPTPAMKASDEPACQGVVVGAPEGPVADAGNVSATAVVDLEVFVRFAAGTKGEGVAVVELLTPNGHLYQSMSLPFAAEAAEGQTRIVESYPKPLAVRHLARTKIGDAEEDVLRFSLPVGGTAMVSRGLYGRWTIRARVGAREPCGTATFTLTP